MMRAQRRRLSPAQRGVVQSQILLTSMTASVVDSPDVFDGSAGHIDASNETQKQGVEHASLMGSSLRVRPVTPGNSGFRPQTCCSVLTCAQETALARSTGG